MSSCNGHVTLLLVHVQRSYSPELFDDAIGRMVKAQIKTAIDIEHFKDLQRRVQKIVNDNRQREQDWGEIPDEFRGAPTSTTVISDCDWREAIS